MRVGGGGRNSWADYSDYTSAMVRVREPGTHLQGQSIEVAHAGDNNVKRGDAQIITESITGLLVTRQGHGRSLALGNRVLGNRV